MEPLYSNPHRLWIIAISPLRCTIFKAMSLISSKHYDWYRWEVYRFEIEFIVYVMLLKHTSEYKCCVSVQQGAWIILLKRLNWIKFEWFTLFLINILEFIDLACYSLFVNDRSEIELRVYVCIILTSIKWLSTFHSCSNLKYEICPLIKFMECWTAEQLQFPADRYSFRMKFI